MSQKDKERIQRITAGLKSSGFPEAGPRPSAPLPSFSTKLEPHVAQAALRGFQPFTSDPAKQARYNAYLQSQAGQDGSFPALQPIPGQPRDEFNKELEDYAKAASLFKPISGAMAGRFTSAAVIDFGPKVHEGLHTPTKEDIAAKEAQERKEAEDRISPTAHAAKMGMYGLLTREKKPWQPARLLCKRFGVKDPNPDPEVASEAAAGSSAMATPSFTHSEQQEASGSKSAADTTTPTQARDGPRDLANVGLGEDETQGQDTLTYERPSMDIFKAIFASDDEESDEEKEPEEDKEPTPLPTTNGRDLNTGFTPATVIFDDTPVDINTFKLTFIPREAKSKKTKNEEKSKEKKKEKKDKKKKEQKSLLVSFEVDEDGDNGAELKQPKDRPKKKQRTEKVAVAGDGNEQGIWVAPKSPPSGFPPPSLPAQDGVTFVEPSLKGRKRAIDFM